ncbi:carboxymuconolactone decarboxylase family protein [Thiomonas sp. FB-6]|uniref:carboxymuconolactone decarboxylase family protein n=1 Tax=Thiomonas sp. FB-6 TaxID=1158291 RepID=UPI00037605C2|nr:carboxymuconolactone decarboxylase family protein [Thiomonas sp. FB-6]
MNPRLDFRGVRPEALKPLIAAEQWIGRCGLEQGLIELVRLRASQINGCAYCVDLHASDARAAGESERRLAALGVWREVPFFTARERAALEWTEALTLVASTHVPDAAWNTVREHFDETEVVDLSLLVSTINSWNRFAIAFRKPPEAA